MKKVIPLVLAALVGGCLAQTVPAFADAIENVTKATIAIVVVDTDTGAKRTLICAPAPEPSQPEPLQGFH